jgi:21S rRNA (uridine2791-2'-O)-methyltransferase
MPPLLQLGHRQQLIRSILTDIHLTSKSSSATFVVRWASSNARWKQRQSRDAYARDAKVQGLKSRAAFKLLEMDAKHRIFKRGQTVIDLASVQNPCTLLWAY